MGENIQYIQKNAKKCIREKFLHHGDMIAIKIFTRTYIPRTKQMKNVATMQHKNVGMTCLIAFGGQRRCDMPSQAYVSREYGMENSNN